MNIAFDMQFMKSGSMLRGIGRYCHNMIQSITKLNSHHSFFHFYPDLSGEEKFKNHLQQFLKQHSIDVFHMVSPFEYFPFIKLERDWFGSTQVATILYDVIPLIFHQIYLTKYADFYYHILNFIKNSEVIFSISETTKNDAISYAGIDPLKIHVIYGGIEEKFITPPSIKSPHVLAHHQIHKPYVLFIGNNEFRKNIFRLIQAFSIINKSLNHKYQLVITSFIVDQGKEILMNIAKNLGISNDVIITGYIPDDDLITLYQSAELFAFPSLYEGFGLPALEAMACGTPVLTSNNSSLSEITGHAAYHVNPFSIEEITNGLMYMLETPSIKKEYIKKGLQHVANYTWENVGREVLRGYDTLDSPSD